MYSQNKIAQYIFLDLTPKNGLTFYTAMFSKKTLLNNPVRKSEEVKKSAGKVVDPKRDTPTRAKVRFRDLNDLI